MKITENINLAGLIFTIDEDAFLKLQNYLNSIERYFGSKEEREEILADIEARIAELFQTQLNKRKEVVTITDVDEVIGILGMPEDFVGDTDTKEEKSSQSSTRRPSRLFRDPDSRVIGGVCSGLGQYFNIDPVILRVVFVILLFFAMGGGVVYIILWIVLPPAISVTDKFEMRGYKVTQQ